MSKLGAMVRYEFLMAWRRRSLPILWILLLVGVIGFTLLIANVNRQVLASLEAQIQQGQVTAAQFHTNLLFSAVIAAMVFSCVSVTLMVGEVIPLDSQFKVRELLETFPISQTMYLGGKLLSVWSGLILGWFGVGVIAAVALNAIIGAYDLRVFLLLWLLLPLPPTLSAAAFSVLFGGLVHSRRAALVVGLLILPFSFYLSVVGTLAFVNLTSLIDPIYTYGSPMLPSRERIVIDAVNGLLLHVGVIAGAWGVVWLVVRRRFAR